MKYLFVVASDDLDTLVAESGYDMYIDNGRVVIESDYYHSDIQECLGDYNEQVEPEIITWLNRNVNIVESCGDVLCLAYDLIHDVFVFNVTDAALGKEE